MLAAGGDDHRLTQTGLFVGTVGYVAPEQVDDPRAVDTRADLYSVGCLLYAMLAGRPPFKGDSVVDTLIQVREKEAPDPRTVNPAADRDLLTRFDVLKFGSVRAVETNRYGVLSGGEYWRLELRTSNP